jgi:hypothetical protein
MSDIATWSRPDILGYSECKIGGAFVGFIADRTKLVGARRGFYFDAFAHSSGPVFNRKIGRFAAEAEAKHAVEAEAIRALKGIGGE